MKDFILGSLNDLGVFWLLGCKVEYKDTISETGWLDGANHRRWAYKIGKSKWIK